MHYASWHQPVENFQDLLNLRFNTHGRTLKGESDSVQRNITRASWAAQVLVTYANVSNCTTKPLGMLLSDLLADLRHLSDIAHLGDYDDYDQADANAELRYDEEIRGEL